MNLTIVLISILTGMLFIDFLLIRPRWYKNFIGSIRGDGGCPNCGDKFNWKGKQEIICKIQDGGFWFAYSGLSICNECCEKCNFNYEEIAKNLTKNSWKKEEISEIIEIFKKLKKNPLKDPNFLLNEFFNKRFENYEILH